MRKNIISFSAICVLAAVKAEYPPFEVIVDGEPQTVYLMSKDKYTHDAEDKIEISLFKRTYFSKTPYLDPDQFFKPKMLGGFVEYTVDLNQM